MDTSLFPVEASWDQAVSFCKKLSELSEEKKAGRVYRLPTEAEWEYACRAGTTTETAFGDTLSSLQANFNGNAPFGDAPKGPHLKRTTRVGSYKPNAWGLHDMHGNVWEWCSDWLDDDYYARSPVEDPKGPETGKQHVVRGGAYFYTGEHCRSATRSHPVRAGIGFRVVCDQEIKDPGKP
jgi:formylglycine-generating enzyme required for sulfatase activity